MKHIRFTKDLKKKLKKNPSGVEVATIFGKKKIESQFPISVSPARALS